ncbi:uncharacterized protein MELLADRAFT_101171 [Melampsora larici-populina 98AG31]|uniref:RING-type domain-containing protein n=1 Tax=Melampsora larici-populina (strain 98AG31 / pathotype 3-4-7) TaxID=747676 RepID=F4R3U7_MELLP|nr:uncharacterized protein MELLADRAFT_101171 [Melampsora larici-populina 98AG31]EGG13103.1 hypothetical protein MELLADRAFT_101171 [Melampsora larici-populina 98AG31]
MTTTTMSHSDLLNKIQSIQIELDGRPTEGVQERLLTSTLLNICDAEASMLDIERRDTWDESDTEVWRTSAESRASDLQTLRPIFLEFNLNLPPVVYLPDRGSTRWFSLYIYVSLLTESSHLIQNLFESEEESRDCPICFDGFNHGQRYIRLPCYSSHLIHEKCLTMLAGHTLLFLCPICRRAPYLS